MMADNYISDDSDDESYKEDSEEEEEVEEKSNMSGKKNYGLYFPPARVHRYMKEKNYADHIGKSGSVFLTGVMECLTHYVLKESCREMKTNGRKRIQARDIRETFLCDAHLQQTPFPSVIITMEPK
jgi:histone H3/H4